MTELLIVAGFLGFYGLIACFGLAIIRKLSTLGSSMEALHKENQALLQYHEEARNGLLRQPDSLQVTVLNRKLLDVARLKHD